MGNLAARIKEIKIGAQVKAEAADKLRADAEAEAEGVRLLGRAAVLTAAPLVLPKSVLPALPAIVDGVEAAIGVKAPVSEAAVMAKIGVVAAAGRSGGGVSAPSPVARAVDVVDEQSAGCCSGLLRVLGLC